MRPRLWLLSSAALLGTSCGLGTDSDPVPFLEIVFPVDGSSVAGTVELRVLAFSDSGIKEVRFFVDNTLLFTDTQTPFAADWNTRTYSDGPHSIRVEAEDLGGKESQLSITVKVVNNPAPN